MSWRMHGLLVDKYDFYIFLELNMITELISFVFARLISNCCIMFLAKLKIRKVSPEYKILSMYLRQQPSNTAALRGGGPRPLTVSGSMIRLQSWSFPKGWLMSVAECYL